VLDQRHAKTDGESNATADQGVLTPRTACSHLQPCYCGPGDAQSVPIVAAENRDGIVLDLHKRAQDRQLTWRRRSQHSFLCCRDSDRLAKPRFDHV